jgi:hypothetical protein
LAIVQVEPDTVLPGTWIRVFGEGFVAPSEGDLTVNLLAGDRTHAVDWEWVDANELNFRIEPDLFTSLGGVGAFHGEVLVEVVYPGGTRRQEGRAVSWTLEQTLQPRLTGFSPAEGSATVFLGDLTRVSGSGFLLKGEGTTRLRISGTFTPQEGLAEEWNRSFVLPAQRRELLEGALPADALGLQPGRFRGDVVPVNEHENGAHLEGTGLSDVYIELAPTVITRYEPTSASRGQWIDFVGRGFAGGSATTTVRIEGTFTDSEGQVMPLVGSDALVITPEVQSGETMRYVLRVTPDGYGGLRGLGAVAGVLRGTATPVVYHQSGSQVGVPYRGEIMLNILPQKQVVYLKYLPGFTDALREFGLRNVEDLVRARILDVVRRDYQGINVEFRIDRPTDFLEYSVIEIGGEDPNRMGLLGLDNSMMGKDSGNIYFDDIIGGVSAENRESGHFAYGGVFVTSYLGFSPSHDRPLPIASEVFDEVFGPFVPRWGGDPVESDEYPFGGRAGLIERGLTSLGNMIGNTISHELGHTLGLADGPAGMLHNLVPEDNQIMDSGIHRDFEERAELNGRGPARWTDKNRRYLERILPY